MSSTTHQTRSNTINDNDVNILEIILFQNLSSLQRIASTCKKWKEVTLEFCDEQKMKYLKYNTNTSQTQLLEELEIEIFNCSSGYMNDEDDEIPESWRDLIIDWEQNWKYYREYTFFYKYKLTCLPPWK